MEVFRRLPGEIYRSKQLSVTLPECDNYDDSQIETSSVKNSQEQFEIQQLNLLNSETRERSKTPITASSLVDTDNKIKRGWIFSTDLIDGLEPEKISKIAAEKKIRSESEAASMKSKEISNQCNVATGTGKNDIMDDEAHLKVSYSPGKKGGNFGLPLGAKLTVPDGLFGKKDSITCQVAPVSQRWRHCPVLPSYEHMTSEIFSLNSTLHPLKKAIILQIPYYKIDKEFNEINVKGIWKDENEWVNVGFLNKDTTPPSVELEIDRLGVFIVTFTPKKELFDVTPQGCLYNAHISRYISVRFPKKAADKSFQCAIQITPIPADKLELAHDHYPVETSDIVQATEFIDILPSVPCNFRRAVSVKLPLPTGVELEDLDENNNTGIAVMQKTEQGWELVESKYKYTRTTVTFDVKSLSRFCIAQSKPDRKKRLITGLPILEGRNDKEKGEIIVFLNLQEKFWFMVLECFPESKAQARIADMKSRGFRDVKKEVLKLTDVLGGNENKFFRRPPPVQAKPKPSGGGFEIYDGMKWKIEVVDDIKINFDSDYFENKELHYFKHLPESYRKFVIEPKTNDERSISGAINLLPLDLSDQKLKDAATFTLRIDIDEETVRAYFRPDVIPEEPEPEKEKPNLDLLNSMTQKETTPVVPTIQKFKPLPPLVMERLMKPTRKPLIVDKESKCLSGKSLMNIAKMVPEGLTLAVHLDLPDSTITGLGFDAISNGLSMTDVTYKILLYWKRKMKDKNDGAIDRLTDALREMGRSDIATVVYERHKACKEMTPEAVGEVLTQRGGEGSSILT